MYMRILNESAIRNHTTLAELKTANRSICGTHRKEGAWPERLKRTETNARKQLSHIASEASLATHRLSM